MKNHTFVIYGVPHPGHRGHRRRVLRVRAATERVAALPMGYSVPNPSVAAVDITVLRSIRRAWLPAGAVAPSQSPLYSAPTAGENPFGFIFPKGKFRSLPSPAFSLSKHSLTAYHFARGPGSSIRRAWLPAGAVSRGYGGVSGGP